MEFRFNYNGGKIKERVILCNDFLSQCRGLMFRGKKWSKSLLFVFKRSRRRAIHSFFCKPFIAVWFNKGKIVEARLVPPWRFCINPYSRFDKLLEVPTSNNLSRIFSTERERFKY